MAPDRMDLSDFIEDLDEMKPETDSDTAIVVEINGEYLSVNSIYHEPGSNEVVIVVN